MNGSGIAVIIYKKIANKSRPALRADKCPLSRNQNISPIKNSRLLKPFNLPALSERCSFIKCNENYDTIYKRINIPDNIMRFRMRYIGGKSLLLEDIKNVIDEIAPNTKSIIDLFSGSGCVSDFFKQSGYSVFCNDQLYFSYVLLRGITQLSEEPKFKNLKITDNPIAFLNDLSIENTHIDIKDCFIYNNYSPHENCERMYFSPENAIKIDIIRITIEDWYRSGQINEDEYYYLIAALISAIPYISNIAGVYAAYLKHWDPRALKKLKLEKPELIHSNQEVFAFNEPCNILLPKIKADVLYSDSPYNTREYLPNYHILETVTKYDYPEIKGITGMREYKKQKSDFCAKSTVAYAFESMIRLADVKYVVISYNNEGLISTDDLSNICKKYAVEGTFKLKEVPYRRYKSKVPNNKQGLMEQIYYFEKRKDVYIKSPMNYIGGKYKLLPQIEKLFPPAINTMVDLFCGGCDVSVNTIAKNIYANDINNFVIDIFKEFQNKSTEELLNEIDSLIKEYKLSKENKEGFIELRNHYNSSEDKNPIELYTLVCYSFNYQFRFNSLHEYNNPFGKNRSHFSGSMRTNLIRFKKAIDDITFSCENFKNFDYSKLKKGDFLYADPPYLITTGSYNDGKRGFEGWTEEDDLALFKILDDLSKKGVSFALSNVLEHKGKSNDKLKEWASKYKIHYLNYDYKNSSYQGKNKEKDTIEVLITNY